MLTFPSDHQSLISDFFRIMNLTDYWGKPMSAEDAFALAEGLNGGELSIDEVWQELESTDKGHFVTVVEHITGRDVFFCEDCSEPHWTEDGVTIGRYSSYTICEGCRDNGDYYGCNGCSGIFYTDDTYSVGDLTFCDSCRSDRCSWCEDCDEYYLDEDADDHRHTGCECEAPHLRFRFPANGHGTIAQDERMEVTLPAGVISDQGMSEIEEFVIAADLSYSRYEIRKIIRGLDPEWQKRQGNFTRRLSKAMYQQLGIKVPPHVISEVGNLARQHTADVATYHVEFTRALNGSAEDFWHDDSCWWGGHSESRCALKSWGGLAIRSYNGEEDESYFPAGRAWIQPLNEHMSPTQDAETAHAYLVYNGYGNLEGYTPARIVAHLSGKTYRKIGLELSPQYVNNSSGYLVADETTCSGTPDYSWSGSQHWNAP